MANSVRLGDVAHVKHGFAFSGEFFRDAPPGDILVTPGNFSIGGGFSNAKAKYYDGPKVKGYNLHPDDLIVTMTDLSKNSDTLGFPALVPESNGTYSYLHNQRVGLVQITSPKIDKGYLYYVMASPPYRAEVLASATGTAVKHTSPGRIEAFRFNLPSISEQRAVASILGSLDDRIVLNRKSNAALEAVARALFKSWFVDFAPTRAKALGRDTALAPEITTLFPAYFAMRDVRSVPEGWAIRPLGQVLSTIECGSRPKGGVSAYLSGIPSIGAESIVGAGIFDYAKTKYVPVPFFASMRRGVCEPWDVLLYKDGGAPGKYEPHVTIVGENFPFAQFCINEHVYRLRSKDNFAQAFLYLLLSSDGVMQDLRKKGTGVAVPGLNSTALSSVEVIEPSDKIVKIFDDIVGPMIRSILTHAAQSRTLAITRETLLPRLISGELHVRDADQILEQSA